MSILEPAATRRLTLDHALYEHILPVTVTDPVVRARRIMTIFAKLPPNDDGNAIASLLRIKHMAAAALRAALDLEPTGAAVRREAREG